jgi:hypothetical protein
MIMQNGNNDKKSESSVVLIYPPFRTSLMYRWLRDNKTAVNYLWETKKQVGIYIFIYLIVAFLQSTQDT